MQRIDAKALSGYRGHALSPVDKLRARAIEMLMCNFAIDEDVLLDSFGTLAKTLDPVHAQVLATFDGVVSRTATGLEILTQGRALTRIIAQHYDSYTDTTAIYSKAS